MSFLTQLPERKETAQGLPHEASGDFKTVTERPPEWCSGLRHCIVVLAVPLDILGSSPGSVAAGCDRETHTIGPASSGLGEGLAGIDVLVPSRASDSCAVPGALHADTVARCFLRHIGVADFWVKWALCQEAVRLGCLCFGGCTLASPESVWELQR